jgi:hypothetical protein
MGVDGQPPRGGKALSATLVPSKTVGFQSQLKGVPWPLDMMKSIEALLHTTPA